MSPLIEGPKNHDGDVTSSFLFNVTYFCKNVVVRGTNSESSPVTSGVPQESVLGLLLFPVYINDMPLTVESSLPLFADDSLLYKTIKKLEDTYILQNDLDKLVLWEKKLVYGVSS